LLESTVWTPVRSLATICSTLHGVVSAHASPWSSVGVHAAAPPVGSLAVTT
jgi:hypothetical protein